MQLSYSTGFGAELFNYNNGERESAILVNIHYQHEGIQTDDSAKTTLDC
jgi:hypothetical protein